MTIETKDLLGWLITGGLGAAGLVLNLLTRRDARRKAQRDAEAIWSLDPARGQAREAQGQLFALKLRDPTSNRFRLSEIRVVEPPGARIAHVATLQAGGRADVNAGPVPGGYVETLTFNRDVRGGLSIGSDGQLKGSTQAGTVRFFADWPSAIARKNVSRLVVVVSVEEISPSRRESCLTVKSQAIEWTIKAPASAM